METNDESLKSAIKSFVIPGKEILSDWGKIIRLIARLRDIPGIRQLPSGLLVSR